MDCTNLHSEVAVCAPKFTKIHASDVPTTQPPQQFEVAESHDPISSSQRLNSLPSHVIRLVRLAVIARLPVSFAPSDVYVQLTNEQPNKITDETSKTNLL